jgi:hypothetical protein
MSTIISIKLPPGLTERGFLAFLMASANSVPSATAAVLRRANNDGFPLTEEQARGIVLFVRTWAAREFARLAGGPSNVLTADVVVSGEQRA